MISDAVRSAEASIAGMALVESRSDADIAEVKQSAADYHGVEARTEPLRRFLDFWQAVKWLDLAPEEKKALQALFDGHFGQPLPIAAGLTPPNPPAGLENGEAALFGGAAQQLALAGTGVASAQDYLALKSLLQKAHALAAEQKFLHWQIAFPGVWRNWPSAEPDGGFDAVIGNPPWDRMKMQEVEWFAARAPQVAHQARAADRKRLIAKMKAAGDPLIAQYERASSLAETAMERARQGGDYPLLSRGDINIYSLFVERAQALIKPDGIAGLLTPSGIASDFGASAFFRKVATAGRVQCLFDFENRRGERREPFFPDIDSRFKFCTFVCGGPKRAVAATECAFFLRDPPELVPAESRFVLSAADFSLVNPNTCTAPIFRTRRDAELTTAIYRRLPVLVDRSNGVEKRAWPVRYMTMFHMAGDSALFQTQGDLEKLGAYPVGLGIWRNERTTFVPLIVGRMIDQFNHRYSSAHYDEEANLLIKQFGHTITPDEQLADPSYFPTPVFWVDAEELRHRQQYYLVFRDIARNNDVRTFIATVSGECAYGHTAPLLVDDGNANTGIPGLVANFNSFACDYVLRQKSNTTHLTWFLVEQLPVLTPKHYERRFGRRTSADIVKDHVLRLTYTAHDMAPFARDMGYVNKDGTVRPPIIWNEAERRHLRARLDALYFILYGVTDEDDIRYILSTFPIVERKDRQMFDGVYLTRELILWYKRALDAGDPDSLAPEAEVIRLAKARGTD